jgi:hypothetical protein
VVAINALHGDESRVDGRRHSQQDIHRKKTTWRSRARETGSFLRAHTLEAETSVKVERQDPDASARPETHEKPRKSMPMRSFPAGLRSYWVRFKCPYVIEQKSLEVR